MGTGATEIGDRGGKVVTVALLRIVGTLPVGTAVGRRLGFGRDDVLLLLVGRRVVVVFVLAAGGRFVTVGGRAVYDGRAVGRGFAAVTCGGFFVVTVVLDAIGNGVTAAAATDELLLVVVVLFGRAIGRLVDGTLLAVGLAVGGRYVVVRRGGFGVGVAVGVDFVVVVVGFAALVVVGFDVVVVVVVVVVGVGVGEKNVVIMLGTSVNVSSALCTDWNVCRRILSVVVAGESSAISIAFVLLLDGIRVM